MTRPLLPLPPAEADFVRAAREQIGVVLPGVDFDAVAWSLQSRKRTQHKRTNANVYFTLNGSTTSTLPRHFAEVVKAACVHDVQSAAKLNNTASAARWLWDAIVQRRGGDGDAFVWVGLTADDLLAAEGLMAARLKSSSVYMYCGCLGRITEVLAAHGVIGHIQVAFETPRPSSHGGHTQESDEDAVAKLPSQRALNAIGDIYKAATDPRDRLVLSCLAILLASGFRVGEVLTLPSDCEVDEVRDGIPHYGLRFNKEKSSGRQRVLEVHWLTPQQALLARSAIACIRATTEAARRQARLLERRLDAMTFDRVRQEEKEWVVVSGPAWNAELSADEAARHLGLATGSLAGIPQRALPRTRRSGEVFFRAADVLNYLQAVREKRCRVSIAGVVSRGDGTLQMPSQSLLVTPLNWMHSRKADYPLLVDTLTEQHVNDFLGGRWERCEPVDAGAVPRGDDWGRPVIKSAFDRYGYAEADGRPIEMNSHQFRHWVTTTAKLAGVEDEVIMRWQGREHRGDLSAYTHLTRRQRVDALRDAVKSGRLVGEVADIYFAIAESERDAFIEGQFVAVHVTSIGLCVHDLNSAPCDRALGCLGCPDYLHDTSDPAERAQLVQLERRLVSVLAQSRGNSEDGAADLAASWVAHHEQKLANVRKVLDTAPSGSDPFVRPFAGEPSQFKLWS